MKRGGLLMTVLLILGPALLRGDDSLNGEFWREATDDWKHGFAVGFIDGSTDKLARNPNLLENIDGSMRQYFSGEADYQTLRTWVVSGAQRLTYDSVASITAVSCTPCHSTAAHVANVVTETYEDLAKYVAPTEVISADGLIDFIDGTISFRVTELYP